MPKKAFAPFHIQRRRRGGKEGTTLMHIEPGIIDGVRMALAYGTTAAAAGYSVKLIADDLTTHSIGSFAGGAVLAGAKMMRDGTIAKLFTRRLHHAS